ncbi:MAG: DUF896 domain-containing protein [Lachnospiraceae bacterium]|nr:DUF896 domain-containing protein [Lachnospiraceae bacterium]MBQ9233303.1 DUF896 domain-containing protein [Lachnospiraceae bacterium]
MTDEKIKRINELAHKSKTHEGLTEDEKKEQAVLRREFIDSVKGNLKSQLDNINIQEKDGSITHVKDIPLKKKK